MIFSRPPIMDPKRTHRSMMYNEGRWTSYDPQIPIPNKYLVVEFVWGTFPKTYLLSHGQMITKPKSSKSRKIRKKSIFNFR
jgi:hypothetical protein